MGIEQKRKGSALQVGEDPYLRGSIPTTRVVLTTSHLFSEQDIACKSPFRVRNKEKYTRLVGCMSHLLVSFFSLEINDDMCQYSHFLKFSAQRARKSDFNLENTTSNFISTIFRGRSGDLVVEICLRIGIDRCRNGSCAHSRSSLRLVCRHHTNRACRTQGQLTSLTMFNCQLEYHFVYLLIEELLIDSFK